MAAKATVSWEWRWRLALIATLGILFGAWALYDGLVAYPEHNRVRAEWDKLQADGREHEWPAKARELGVSEEQPDPMKGDTSILTQFIMAGITLPVGLFAGYHFVRSLTRWIASDERGLSTSWGEDVPFTTIQTLNKDRWKSKGIAIVTYEGDKGVGKLVLDDWKFSTGPIRQMVREAEDHLRPEQITGGAPEAVADATSTPAASEKDDHSKPQE
jgi:hypothetical protein